MTELQNSLFGGEPEASIARAVEGNEDWVGAVLEVIWGFPAGTKFTSDRLWWEVKHLPEPRNPKAMGGVMRAAKKKGIAVQTGEYIKSTRPACHRRPIPVWRRT